MMRVLKTREFSRDAHRRGIADTMLLEASRRAELGLVDADLGGGPIEQRVPRPGQGRSGGYRTLMAYRAGGRLVFVHCFAKSERDNIGNCELAYWRRMAGAWLEMGEVALSARIAAGELEEVRDDA